MGCGAPSRTQPVEQDEAKAAATPKPIEEVDSQDAKASTATVSPPLSPFNASSGESSGAASAALLQCASTSTSSESEYRPESESRPDSILRICSRKGNPGSDKSVHVAPARTEKRTFTWQSDAVIGPLLSLAKSIASTSSHKDESESSERGRAGSNGSEADSGGKPCKMKSSTSVKRVPSRISATSTILYERPSQTLIFLDWDDTVFPSTEVFHRWGFPACQYKAWRQIIQCTESQTAQLKSWAEVLLNYLTTASDLSDRVAIVTNSGRPWVDVCIDFFAPDVRKLINQKPNVLRIIYARETLPPRLLKQGDLTEEEYGVQLTKAKYLAMKAEVTEFYSQYEGQTWKNIISVGDASYEHDAIQDVTFHRKSPQREHIRLKVFTCPESPSLADLTYRLRLATLLLPAYVRYDGDIDLDMNEPDRLHAIADALELPLVCESVEPGPMAGSAISEDFMTLRQLALVSIVEAGEHSTATTLVTKGSKNDSDPVGTEAIVNPLG